MTEPRKGPLARARFRKLTAPVRFAFGDRIDYLNGTHWDAATAHRGALMQRAYFRELERVLPANLDQRYALLHRDGEPVAALAMQLVELAGAKLARQEPATDKGLRGLVTRGAKAIGRRLSARVLVVGNLLTYGCHGIAIRPGLEGDPAIWHGIGEAAYRVRRAEKHAGSADFVLVKDLTALELRQSHLLHDLGFRTVETDPNMVLTLDPGWRNHDDYLAALTSKYRKNVRSRVLKPSDDAGIAVDIVHDVAAAAGRLQELYLAVHESAALRPLTLGPDYWPALAVGAGDRVRFTGLRRGAELLGFIVTLLDDGGTAIAYHIGFDREVAKELPLYLRLMHASVADAIELGAARVSFGRTALEPKAMLGARPVPLHVWVRHRQPVLNKVLRGLLGRVHHDEAPERNPFAV
ncbi:MAG: GNAT family N-acetyltransferase [Planctomycetota bacterium]